MKPDLLQTEPRLARLGFWLCCAAVAMLASGAARAFDHAHAAWDSLLGKVVVIAPGGHASAVRYGALRSDRAALQAYLQTLSAVPEAEYQAWSKPQRLAFLINAYNAFTIDLILTRYPKLESIKDLGSVFQSPWRKKFFTLLGQERALDNVEHDLIRAPGAFDEPRIHVAVVCASVGCPMLRNEAWTADKLETQLEDSMRRFLGDRTRNRFDAATGRLQVSRIFDWYGKDFTHGHGGFDSLKTTFARYAPQLSSAPDEQARVSAGNYKLEYLDYDWRLNDAR